MPSTSGVRLAGTRPPGSFSMLAAKCSTFARLLAATSATSTGSRAQRLIGRGEDGRVHLGHQVGGLVQEHPRDPADQVRGLR